MLYRRVIRCVVGCFIVLGFHGMPKESWAEETDTPWVSRIVSIQGRVLAKRHGEADWQPVRLDDTLFAGDRIRVEANSRAGIVLRNDAVIRLDQNTTLAFPEIEPQTNLILKLLKGAAQFFSRWPRRLTIATPFVNGVVEGTEFFVRVDDAQTQIDLFEGRIRAVNQLGELQLSKGQGALASANRAPRIRIVAHPRESVQWSLYYPPILAARPRAGIDALRESIELYNQGQAAAALDSMENIAQSSRDSRFYTYRAGLLLNVGRVTQAREDIQQALLLHAANSEALALEAVIAVVQNRKDDAARAAQKAAQLNPRSAAAQIALSYAHQADFNLPAALQAARAATTHDPENGTAWARLAEMRLSTGELDKGVQAARKAAALDPHIAHAHTILGFAYLTRIKIQKAREAFTRAIALDSAAPLPRLGLGLSKIRTGNLEQGRAELEIAAGLDPGNALIRSYLGKAYFDEKRRPLDERQFEIAKTLDPNDPTPWFYDAIRKQTLNRPVEALHDLQKSIELNDNRAVYRSRLLLDEDLAVKGANLARIYEDLGFQQLALVGGFKSLNTDPASHSTHRFLADAYAALPRHEIARVSELLQSQLLQPISITPVQPHLAESKLFILNGAGPSTLSLNEYTPMFNRNRLALQASGLAGGNSTVGDEIVQSGIWGRYSYSLGQFHYETDGFRQNNDQQQDLYNVFVQMSLSPKTSIQAEYRRKDIERGDLELRFDPDNYYPSFRHKEKIDTIRFGLKEKFSPHSTLLASVIYQKEDNIDSSSFFKSDSEIEALLFEVRHIFNYQPIQLSIGGGYFKSDLKLVDTYYLPALYIDPSGDESKHSNLYIYSSINYPGAITWSIGASGDFVEGEIDDRDQFNPKLGMNWDLSSNTTLRTCLFRTMQRSLVSSQTIEPVQVAGFNQFFEDGLGTDAWNYGMGIDQKTSAAVYSGIELMNRRLDVPYSLTDPDLYSDWDEILIRAYINWIVLSNLTLSVELHYELFERDHDFVGSNSVARLETYKLPFGINYFHHTDLSFRLKTTYVDQSGEFGNPVFEDLVSDSDQFWVVDASVRYQLPKRLGYLTIEAKNILNASFKFQDTDPANPQIFPEPYLFARLEFVF